MATCRSAPARRIRWRTDWLIVDGPIGIGGEAGAGWPFRRIDRPFHVPPAGTTCSPRLAMAPEAVHFHPTASHHGGAVLGGEAPA
jgi:hypothetical protein